MLSCRPLSLALCPGARPGRLNPPLWCGGWQALLDYYGGFWVQITVIAQLDRIYANYGLRVFHKKL